MDWSNVTADELLAALQEVDWSQPPRPLGDFAAKFSVPSTRRKLETRLKCNVYNYRANYSLLMAAALLPAFFRRPALLVVLVWGALGSACWNNPFAASFSNSLLKLVRRVHVPTAQKLRAISSGHSGLGAPGRSKPELRIVGVPRAAFALALQGLALLLLWRSGALLVLALSLLLGSAAVLLHAAFRVPNLKTRLASAREEFRAVWRGYQAAEGHDFTL